MDDWYKKLEDIKDYIRRRDPKMERVFAEVDSNGFLLHTVVKSPLIALIGAIIGQKISYNNAKNLRKKLYEKYGDKFGIDNIINEDLSFLGKDKEKIIKDVLVYIRSEEINIETKEGIIKLGNVKGIGDWTINTTLLTCLMDWNIYPRGDKFLEKRIKKLYGDDIGKPVGSGEYINILEKNWQPFKSVVTWYLWRWF